MSYSVFRIEGVKTTGALRGIGKHNKDRISSTNPDIDKNKSSENIELICCQGSYLDKFNKITSDMRKEHDERMKHMRSDRVASFEKSINTSKSDVACEMVFTSDESFFKDMGKEDITKWAKESLEFVTKAIGIPEKHIIHATVHMDEKTPHLHVVAVPLVKAYDGRRKKEVLKISRAKYIPDRVALSKLQDRYNDRLREKGYDLERGVVGSKSKHKGTVEYKQEQLAKLEKQIEQTNKLLDKKLADASKLIELEDKVDSIEFKPYMFDKNKMIINADDLEFLKESSKKGFASEIKCFDLEERCNKKDKAMGVLNSKISNYADKVSGLEKKLKVKGEMLESKEKKFNSLYIQAKCLRGAIEKHPDSEEIIGYARKKYHENFKPKEKEKTKVKNINRGWDMER